MLAIFLRLLSFFIEGINDGGTIRQNSRNKLLKPLNYETKALALFKFIFSFNVYFIEASNQQFNLEKLKHYPAAKNLNYLQPLLIIKSQQTIYKTFPLQFCKSAHCA